MSGGVSTLGGDATGSLGVVALAVFFLAGVLGDFGVDADSFGVVALAVFFFAGVLGDFGVDADSFGVVALAVFFLAGVLGDFRDDLEGFFEGLSLGDGAGFLGAGDAGDFTWTEGCDVVFFWLRGRDFPRTRDSLFDRVAARFLGGDGDAFPGAGWAGDKALFLAGVFLRDDSAGAGALGAGGEAGFLLRATGRALRDLCFFEGGGEAVVFT